MEQCGLKSNCFLFHLLHVILLLFMTSYLASALVPANESDRHALLDFKNRITQDPLQIMTSWNDSIHFCNWVGVTCDHSNQRVTVLNLQAHRLAGSMPPSIGNLTFLTGLNLRNNSFVGELPQALGRLVRLQYLNLTWNSFDGKIPTNLSRCAELRVLDIVYNEFTGQIPDQLSSLSKLVYLGLAGNNLTGSFPPWIGNFSSLYILSLALNNLQGIIPNELGQLSKLGIFQIYGNYISGMIPPLIYNISSIFYFSVAQNLLHGQLPPYVGLTLPNLQVFAGGVNNFTGLIPASLSNASELQVLDFAQNGLTGTIPRNLGSLPALIRLNFEQNRLGNGETGDLNFLSFLANCTSLQVLSFEQNLFGGELPGSISNLSTNLQFFSVGYNLLQGSIPIGIENLVNLFSLGLEGNQFSSTVPDVIGKLQKLQGLYLNLNKFSGPIPSSLGNLTALTRLFMEENRFEGAIPPSLGDCRNLQVLNLSSNNLSGTIPKQVMSLSSLSISLVFSNNSLTGRIPFEVGSLNNLAELDLSGNKISGEIPSTVGKCISLQRLHLEGNFLEGTIPESLAALRGIEEIDLSRNNLSGKVPEFLGNLSTLWYLNLSYNAFEGSVSSQGVFANESAIFVAGNAKLCGGIPELHLPECSTIKSRNARSSRVLIPVIITVVVIAVLVCSCATFYMVKNSRTTQSTQPPSAELQEGVSYSDLLKSTDGFSAENLIGSGSFGSVYKGILPGHRMITAVKVLNLQQQGASKSFIDECNALRSIKHRNLLKIITACSSVDHQGNEFKALIFEFMSNGNLDQWLHPREDIDKDKNKMLSLIQRLNIAIDVASALDYLHHHCDTPIVHCDLKPSNVLLDEDLVAHVGDFGLAKFLYESTNPSNIRAGTARLKGSIGYIPPEYGTGGQVSVLGDVYSFGMLLLEMFTGKRPTDDMFKDGLSIHVFTSMALPEHVMRIVDPSMTFIEDKEGACHEINKDGENEHSIIIDTEIQVDTINKIEECLVSLLSIGLSCCATAPRNRMLMNIVVNKLLAIRDSFLKFTNKNRKRMS